MPRPRPDVIGKRFGRLVVLSFVEGATTTSVECRCDCGNTCVKILGNLRSEKTKSCGCFNSEVTSERKRKPIPKGTRFGRLVTLRRNGSKNSCDIYDCICDCGNEISVPSYSLRNKDTKSCGCLNLDRIREQGRTNGIHLKNWWRQYRVSHGFAEDLPMSPERDKVRFTVKPIMLLVLRRDNFTCQLCGKRGGRLNVHHVFKVADHPELADDPRFMITLCRDTCHREAHQYNNIGPVCPELQRYFLLTLDRIHKQVV